MHHRKNLRASFVVTVATGGALALGCSDTVPANGDSGTAPPSSMCPTELPSPSSPCALDDSIRCSFGGGGPYNCPMPANANCYRGRWEISMPSCNPPFPLDVILDVTDAADVIDVTPTSTCPTTAPPSGQPCTLRDSIVCTFGGGTIPSCPLLASARCFLGRWQVSPFSCNPPPDVTDVTDVTDATDTAVTPDVLFVCPASASELGATCAREGHTCGYGDCAGSPTTVATCTGGAWSVSMRSCNPPIDAGAD
jgi:hypothetical protein